MIHINIKLVNDIYISVFTIGNLVYTFDLERVYDVKDKEVLKLVGARIRLLRKERGLSQEALGEKGGFHFSYIGQVERGEKNISLLNLAQIAEALEVNLIQLFSYVDEKIEVTSTDNSIQEIVGMLRETTDEKIRLAKNVLKEILNANT